MERREYDEQTKAAVMAALLTGQSVYAAAKDFKIPVGTVKRWSADAKEKLQPVRNQKEERIGDLIIDNVEAALETTREILNVIKDPKWLRRQEASQIGVLYGIIQDKTYRILEALPDSGDAEEQQSDEGSGE